MAKKDTPKKETKKKGGGGVLFSVALGAALAAAAGYYASHKEEVDREAKKHIKQLAKAYKETRPVVEKKVREVWGEVSDEAIATYMDVRGAVLHSLEEENLEKTGKMIRKQYDKIVEAAIKEARKSGILNKDVEKRLEEIFKMDWKEVQEILGCSAKKVAGIAKKEAKKVVKEVTKGKTGAKKASSRGKKGGTKKTGAKKKPAAKKTTTRKPARKAVRKSTKKK